MESSDDLAEQQLFAEIQASAKKVSQHYDPPSVSAVQSANLLNAARLDRRRTVAANHSSPPSHTSHSLAHNSPAGVNGKTRKGGAGKLKPVNLLRDDAAQQARRELARRGDPFDFGFSSPEKVAIHPPAKARQRPVRNKRVQREASPGLEAPTSHDLPEVEGAEREAPLTPTPPSITDEQHLDEVPETPPTSKRVAGDAGSSRDSMQVPEQRAQVDKRKAADQPLKKGRPSKSPRKDEASAAEDDAEDMLQAKSRSRSRRAKDAHPQIIIPLPLPSARNTRSAKSKQRQPEPPSTDRGPTETDEGREVGGEHPQIAPQQEVNDTLDNQSDHERRDQPPPSAPKPSADVSEVLRKPDRPKRRKFRQLRPTNTTTGLDIPSDNEGRTTQRSKTTTRLEQEPTSAETEKPQRRKGKKPILEPATGPAVTSHQEPQEQEPQEQEPQEQEPKRRKGRQPKALKSSANAEIASGRDAGHEGTAKKTRSKPRAAPPVSVTSAQGVRAQNDNSRYRHPQSHHDDARNAAEDPLEDPEMEDEEVDSGHAATGVSEPAPSDKEDQEEEEEEEEEEEDERDQEEEEEEEEDERDEEDEEDEEDDEDDDDGGGGDHGAQLSDIDEVLKFLDSEEVSGQCQTGDAKAVKEACQTAIEVLADSDTTLNEISVTTKSIQTRLSKYGAGSDEKQHKKLKVDAYAYLFRQVATVLVQLQDWLSDKFRNIFASLKAMRIIVALVSAIVSMKDDIAAWKVKLHSRYKGESYIRDVDTKLIAPLRRLFETYRRAYDDLKNEARKKRAYEEIARKRREREHLEQEQQEIEELQMKKWNRWVDLHVCRLRREPDSRRRQALRMKREYFDKKIARWTADETEEWEERDANGIPFSRVDIFRKRVVPPASPSSVKEEKEWNDEQMEALIYGLQNFAGSSVFEKIFEYYCGVGQPLRRFGVPEITAKAADVRLRLLRKYQEQGWEEAPDWIEKIPILP